MSANDDYGVRDVRLVYSVNAGPEDTISVFQTSGAPLAEVSAGHTLFLEEWQLEPGDLVRIDAAGRAIGGRGKPSSERWMHLAAYAVRPDVMAAIHAHPPATIAFTVAGLTVDPCVLPEVILAFGQVPVTSYATPATVEGAEVVRELIKKFDALVLDRHGSLTVGKNPQDALFKLEKLEHGSHVMFMAHQLGQARRLPPEEVAKLGALREAMGLGRATDVSGQCTPPGTTTPRITPTGEKY